MTIRVFIVDDQALVRAGFAMLIDAQDDMTVAGQAADGAAALSALAAVDADVVLMDIRMPVLDGVEATRQLLTAPGPHTPRVLVLTTFDLDEYVFAALKAGASGFLLKDARPEELLAAIRAIAAGDAVVAPSATRRLLAHVTASLPGAPGVTADRRLEQLTSREREVLVKIARGLTNPEIGAALYMAESTVKTHVGSLLAKLQCRDRVGLVLLAYQTKLV